LLLPATASWGRGETWRVAPGQLSSVLTEAQSGDAVLLETGIHRGPVVLLRAITLSGTPGALLVGDGHGTVLVLAADGIVVEDLVVRGTGSDLGHDDAAIELRTIRNATVRRVTIETRGFGIYVRSGGGHRLIDNLVEGDARVQQARRGNGIHLWHTEHNEIRDNHLSEVRDGVYLSFAHDNTIAGNRGLGLRYGIHYMYSERNTLDSNRFEDSVGGIALMFSRSNLIMRNETHRNQRFGILCQMIEGSRLIDNRASANGRGFYVENSATNRFTGNYLRANGVGAYLTAGSEQNVLVGNSFEGNLVQVYRQHAGRNVWWEEQRGNHWSDYLGLDWNGDGVGETPHRIETASSALLARRPELRWLWLSPLLALLDWWSLKIGAAAPDGYDPYPLVAALELDGLGLVSPFDETR
jgi:nitrous oxidase accessory protein